MCSRKVRLADLKVAELKQELEERELETTGKKQVLQERLAEGLIQEESLKEELQQNSRNLEEKLEENSRNLEEKLQENSRNLEEKLLENSRSLEEKFLENTEGLKKELCGVANFLEERMGTVETEIDKIREQMNTEVDKIKDGVEAEMDKMKEIISDEIKDGIEAEMDKIKETISKLEKQINSASSTEMVNENAMLDLSLNVDEVQEGIKDVKVISEIGKLSMKPPQFDGKTPWANYRRQFEAAAKANGWNAGERAVALLLALRGEATNILQTLTAQEQEDYDQLIKHLELRYGHAHLEHVYHSQLKNRCQKSGESLQEFEADIARLVRLAYPATPENVMERLAVQAFLDGLRDQETRQALILARPTHLVDALARALEFEAAKQCCKSQSKVQTIEEDSQEPANLEAAIRKVMKEVLPEKRQIRCRNWKIGHVRSKCPTFIDSDAGKLKKVDEKGQSSACVRQAPVNNAYVAILQRQNKGVFVDGLINNEPCTMLLDTGATRTILGPSFARTPERIEPTTWKLRTATGEPATVYGELPIEIILGSTKVKHQALVADIEDDAIIGMDIMNSRGFELISKTASYVSTEKSWCFMGEVRG
ncbi:hypothetical protein JTB14_002270 [Gonioctena quinquepunctata]|nr:hypothetical protein JTB14_002270 [Gonioctena quinquepunctata]